MIWANIKSWVDFSKNMTISHNLKIMNTFERELHFKIS